MKNVSRLFMLLIGCSLVFTACKKGDAGPAGAQGPAGAANVQYSGWKTLAMTFSATNNDYEQTITADSIKQNILDNGVILTYMRFTPASGPAIIVPAGIYLQELFSPGKIQLYADQDYSGFEYRYVLIPGGVKLARLSGTSYTKEELQAMSYEQVMKLLGKK
ncbi:MAG: hypothetical protein ACJ75B_10330 [Flavisolibacter sp.]